MRAERTFQLTVEPTSKTSIEVSTFEPRSLKVIEAALVIGDRMNSRVQLSFMVINCPYVPLVFSNKTPPVAFRTSRVTFSK